MNQILSEDPTDHWGGIDVHDSVVFDLGAGDFGRIGTLLYKSTPEYWLQMGAKSVIAIDNQHNDLANMHNDQIKIKQLNIESANQLEELMNEYTPDVVKCDIEGYESLITEMHTDVFRIAHTWAIESHSTVLLNHMRAAMLVHGFHIEWVRGHFESEEITVMLAKRID